MGTGNAEPHHGLLNQQDMTYVKLRNIITAIAVSVLVLSVVALAAGLAVNSPYPPTMPWYDFQGSASLAIVVPSFAAVIIAAAALVQYIKSDDLMYEEACRLMLGRQRLLSAVAVLGATREGAYRDFEGQILPRDSQELYYKQVSAINMCVNAGKLFREDWKLLQPDILRLVAVTCSRHELTNWISLTANLEPFLAAENGIEFMDVVGPELLKAINFLTTKTPASREVVFNDLLSRPRDTQWLSEVTVSLAAGKKPLADILKPSEEAARVAAEANGIEMVANPDALDADEFGQDSEYPADEDIAHGQGHPDTNHIGFSLVPPQSASAPKPPSIRMDGGGGRSGPPSVAITVDDHPIHPAHPIPTPSMGFRINPDFFAWENRANGLGASSSSSTDPPIFPAPLPSFGVRRRAPSNTPSAHMEGLPRVTPSHTFRRVTGRVRNPGTVTRPAKSTLDRGRRQNQDYIIPLPGHSMSDPMSISTNHEIGFGGPTQTVSDPTSEGSRSPNGFEGLRTPEMKTLDPFQTVSAPATQRIDSAGTGASLGGKAPSRRTSGSSGPVVSDREDS
jgi:hypothetical protein